MGLQYEEKKMIFYFLDAVFLKKCLQAQENRNLQEETSQLQRTF